MIDRALFLPRDAFASHDKTDVTVRWLGAAGFAIEHGGFTVLIDPYLTRASLSQCLLSALRPDHSIIARHVPRADAIVVGHTHFDHVLDVPVIAKRTGARVFGSTSASRLCRAAEVDASRVIDVERAIKNGVFESEIGPFRFRFFASAHSKLMLGRVPWPGDIDDCDALPMRLSHYRCGAVFACELTVAGKRVLHLGSAEIVEANLPRNAQSPDLMLTCVAGWTKSERFPERLAQVLAPKNVLLSHWDDFFRPIDEEARALPALRTHALIDRLTRATRDVRVGVVGLSGELAI
jgi:L-ascorbate metabolism protein UlaG (beta-lactamase superfamily)